MLQKSPKCQGPSQGRREGGQGGTMTLGSMDFRGPMGFRKAVDFSGPSRGSMSSRGAHGNDTEKSACEAWRPFCFVFCRSPNFDRKNLRISVKTFYTSIYHFSDQTTAFFPSILDFTKPDIQHIWAGPGPTFGPRRHWAQRNVNPVRAGFRGGWEDTSPPPA